jgi:integrase
LAGIRSTPNDVSIDDVERWTQARVRQGSVYVYQRAVARQFWRILQQCKSTELAPDVIFRQERYGVPLKNFSSRLKAQVEDLLRWKQAAFIVGRPKGARVRQVTAKSLQLIVEALVGFATNVLGIELIDSLQELVTPDIVGGFVTWSMETRRVKGRTVLQRLAHLLAAMNQHPSFAALDLKWFRLLLNDIELETEAKARSRKAERYLEYDVLASIPGQIRATMQKSIKKDPRSLAMLAMTELLIRWLLILPWRQRNLRECRIGGPGPNLYKSKIDPFSQIDKPDWVRRQERENPEAEYWMIRFSADETKTKNEPEMFLPQRLIAPLEEYLDKFRPILASGKDPGTLFINSKGKALYALEVTRLISQNTLRFGGRRVTPHLFRDIIAYTWLKAHPKDFLTVSKMLWHRNIQTTIRIYGSRFDESSAVCAMEAWLEEREADAGPSGSKR